MKALIIIALTVVGLCAAVVTWFIAAVIADLNRTDV